MPNGSLDNLLIRKGNKFSPKHLLNMYDTIIILYLINILSRLKGAASGMSYLESKQIIHGDLGNIFLIK